MSGAADPPLDLNGRESVHGIAALIKEWISLGTPGVVWVRYESDVSRDLMLSLIAPDIPRISFRPPEPLQGPGWLEKTLAALPGKSEALGVVALLFPPLQSGADVETQPIWESFRMLNLRRESIVGFPLVQIWCAPAAIAARAQLEAPDLASWFLLKFRLDELPPPGGWTGSLIPMELSADGLRDFARGLPHESVALRELKVALGRKRLAAVKADSDAERAGILNDLSNDLSRAGKRGEALDAGREALALYRKLAGLNPDVFVPVLAMSLNNFAALQSEVGRPGEAFAAAKEAVELLRGLVKSDPGIFLPQLASSLVNLANVQYEMRERKEEALETSQQAVALYRRLATARPDAFLPGLAMSLNNLATIQNSMGHRQEALGTAREAAQISRQLANANPDAFLPDLAISLNNLANRQSDAGKAEEALETGREAVELYRKLSGANSEAFLPALAKALVILGRRQSELGQHEAATDAFRESIAILRPFLMALPAAHAGLMDFAVLAYTTACEKAGHPVDQAFLAPIQELLSRPPQ